MIVLDTNVLSELLRADPDPVVLAWFRRQRRSEVFTTVINEAELRVGAAIMPDGRRRGDLAAGVERLIARFEDRVLTFDRGATQAYAKIVAQKRRYGRPFEGLDSLIAAVALASHAAVCTRDVGGFTGCGLTVIDPWTGNVTQ